MLLLIISFYSIYRYIFVSVILQIVTKWAILIVQIVRKWIILITICILTFLLIFHCKKIPPMKGFCWHSICWQTIAIPRCSCMNFMQVLSIAIFFFLGFSGIYEVFNLWNKFHVNEVHIKFLNVYVNWVIIYIIMVMMHIVNWVHIKLLIADKNQPLTLN